MGKIEPSATVDEESNATIYFRIRGDIAKLYT